MDRVENKTETCKADGEKGERRSGTNVFEKKSYAM